MNRNILFKRTGSRAIKFDSKANRNSHCVNSVRIRSYSDPHFRAFGLNTERYGVSLRIQSECGKMQTRILRIWTLFTQCQLSERENG